jgi:hypothetical protein
MLKLPTFTLEKDEPYGYFQSLKKSRVEKSSYVNIEEIVSIESIKSAHMQHSLLTTVHIKQDTQNPSDFFKNPVKFGELTTTHTHTPKDLIGSLVTLRNGHAIYTSLTTDEVYLEIKRLKNVK